MAKRIQRKRTKGARMPKNAIYVGRPSKFVNPFWEGQPFPYEHSPPLKSKADAVAVYKSYLKAGLLDFTAADVCRELRGKDLACWCPLDGPCHADVLLEIANA